MLFVCVDVICSKPPSYPGMNHDEEEFIWVKMNNKIEPIDLESKKHLTNLYFL